MLLLKMTKKYIFVKRVAQNIPQRGRYKKDFLALLLTVNEAVCRSHQRVPQTHVPVESKMTKLLSILTF